MLPVIEREHNMVDNVSGPTQDLTAQVRVLPSGGTADLSYLRDGASTTVSVTVGQFAG